MEGDPASEVTSEELEKRDKRAQATQAVRQKRREIFRLIKKIEPQAGRNLKDVQVPHKLFRLAREIVTDPEPSLKFNKVPVYQLLLEDLARRARDSAPISLGQARPVLDGWKQASVSLFRYALNLILAPTRAEFKKMKLSSSFYVYNISRNLRHAERVFLAMGYKPVEKRDKREGQDLVYEGDVNMPPLLETATDLLVMHEEVGYLQEIVGQQVPIGGGSELLEQLLIQRETQWNRAQQISGNTPPISPTHFPGGQYPGGLMAQPSGVPSKYMVGANAHELVHHNQQLSSAQYSSDYANLSGTAGQLQARDVQSAQSRPHGYANLVIGEGGMTPHLLQPSTHGELFAGQQLAGQGAMVYAQSQMGVVQQPGSAGIHAEPQPSPADQTIYYNLSELQQPSYGHQGHSSQAVAGSGWDGRPSSQPTTFVNQPPLPISQGGGSENQQSEKQTVFQNFPLTTGRALDIVCDPTTASSNIEHVLSGPLSSSSSSGLEPRAVPSTTSPAKPTPAPRKLKSHPPPQQTERELAGDAGNDVERENIHGISLRMRESSVDTIAAGLPAPMTTFSPNTHNFESGIPSGLISGLTNVGGSSVGLSSYSGPPGLGDYQHSPQESDSPAHSSASPSVSTGQQTSSFADSSTSLDIYGSGPAEHLKHQQSRSAVVEETGREMEDWVVLAPTIKTQSSLDKYPRDLPPEKEGLDQQEVSSKPHSLEMTERNQESSSPQGSLRHVKSGSNLVQMDPSFLQETHRYQRPETLPRQARSVDIAESCNRPEVPRFSSGTDLLKGSKLLPVPTQPPPRELEPDTPVVGVPLTDWRKMKLGSGQARTHTHEPVPAHIPQSQPRSDPLQRCQAELEQEQLRKESQQKCQEQLQLEKERAERELKERQRETEKRLQEEQREKEEAQRRLKIEQEEKEAAQKKVRDLELQLKQKEVKRENSKSPFLLPQKSVAVVSPTTAEAKGTVSKPEESRLDYGGDRLSGQKTVAQQFAGEGVQRGRANATAGALRAKQEQEPSQPSPETVRRKDPQSIDLATHVDLEFIWVCQFCTNLNPDSFAHCEVCKKPDPRSKWACPHCNSYNPHSLPQCKHCKKLKETLV